MAKPTTDSTKNPVGGLAGVGMKVIQGHKHSSNVNVTEEIGVGISKAIGPESSFQSELSKSNLLGPGPPNNTH